MQVENESSLGTLTQEIYETCREKEFNINSPKQLTPSSLKNWNSLLNILRRPKQTIQQLLMSWNTCQLHRSCLRFLNTARLLRSSRPMSSVFKDWILEDGKIIPICTGFDADRPFVSVDPSLQNIIPAFGARRSHPQGLCPRKRGKRCLAQFRTIHRSVRVLAHIPGDEAFDWCL